MQRRHFLKSIGLAAMAGSTLIKCAEHKKPNIVLILVDDLGWADLGCYGSTFYETPNLDALAQSGMRFTNAYAACPVCSPTRAAILTGRHPVRLGITDWIPGHDPHDRQLLGPHDKHELPLEETTVAEVFKQNGYNTFFAGKWHLGGDGFFPEDQGFEINKGGHDKGSPPGGYYSPYNNPKLTDGPDGEYLPDRLTDEAIRFMREHTANPFLLYLFFYTVHTPIEACRKHIDYFTKKAATLPAKEQTERAEHDGFSTVVQDNAAYASMLYAMDENVGRVVKTLNELKLDKNTIILLTSDNGGLSTLGRHWAPTSNEPLRAGKGWCYEGGIRVPLIIRAPGVTSAGQEHSEPVICMDFFPTLLDLVGLPLLPEKHVDGLSLVPLMTGAAQLQRDALFWHYPHYHGSTWTPGAAMRARDWKVIEFYEYDTVELYDLTTDPSEKNDLAEKMPGKRDELVGELHRWQKGMGAKMPKPNPSYKNK